MTHSRYSGRYRDPVLGAVALLILSGLLLGGVVGEAYYSLVMQAFIAVDVPPVVLQNGTAGTSLVYTNSTSAKVSVEAPLYDYVDNNEPDVDSSADKGMHSNFTAQQAGPDLIYDTLTEENAEAIEDYVDINTSDEDSSADVGTHSSFDNQKAQDSSYDTLTEASQANTHSLDATGGYMIIGDGTPDWGSVTGTISFWIKMDSSVQGRLWGQDGNMETRWSGTNLVLDWGGTASMTSAYSFSADTWYFVAIVWSETSNDLLLHVGDQSTAPSLDSNSLSGTWASTTPAPTENRFLNGLGASQPVDGHGDDLRYWNTARNLTEIQSDYNQTLSGSETNLQSYFKLDNGFEDSGPNNDNGSGSGSYSFSIDVPFSGSSDYDLDVEVQWISVIDFLPTEKLYICTGSLADEGLMVDYWNGTGWENLATDLNAYSCNEHIVSLTSGNFTIRFRDETTVGDTTQDQWQIDASLLRVEGAGDKEDAVDQQSNVDGSADVGIHGNFSALLHGPDLTNDTIAEGNTGGASNTTLIDSESFEGTWPPTGWTETGAWNRESDQAYDGMYSADFDGPAFGSGSGDLDTPSLNCSDAIAIYVSFYFREAVSMTYELRLRFWNGSTWINIEDLGGYSPGWHNWETEITDSQYLISDFQIRWVANALESGESVYVDSVTVKKEVSVPDNYELDLEVQWTNVPYSLPNENLSIYGGAMGVEDITVDAWNGTHWETAFADLSTGWNNASITQWLTTSNFTIRFRGGNETGDASQDTWQIDVALIALWHDGGESYELDLEVQWTGADYTRADEKLCIRTGTFSGSENIQVRVWNSTGSSWDWIMNLTASQWNNVSVSSHLILSNFTMQFLGGMENGDTSQDSWSIDATLLHVWTDESTSESTNEYVDNNTSNVGAPSDIGTHSNFTAQQYGPDLINDTLTEGGGGTVWLWQEDTSGYSSTASYETFQFWSSWTTNSTTSGTVTKIGIYVFADPGNSPQVKLGIYDDSGGSPDNLLGETNAVTITGAGWLDLDITGSGVGISASTTYHVAHITDIAPTTQWRYLKTATPVSDYRGSRVWDTLFDPAGATTKSASYRYGAYRVGYNEPYALDLEAQWTSIDYSRTNEELCIKTGTTGAEDVRVDVWNGSDWINVLTDLTANSWNNVSVSPHLTSSTFTIRFKGSNETNDATQDSWNVDATLLHIWNPAFGWGAWSDELLVNPGFEMGNLTGWTAKGPAASSVEVFNATFGGDSYTNRSLRVGDYGVCTEDQPGTNDDSGVWQNVSLAAYANAIDAGHAVINASAWLYPSEWDWDDCALIVRFFNSSGGFISAWNTTGEYGSGTAYYPQAWMLGAGYSHFTQGQLSKFGCYNYTIPIGTRIVGIQLGMGEHKDTLYCGGQADEASIKIRVLAQNYDYVLGLNNTVAESWQIRLRKYSDSNLNRLQSCTIRFYNSTDGNSNQILVDSGEYVQDTGPWYNLASSTTIYIAMSAKASQTGTSHIYVYLEILVPGSTVYAQYIVAFEIT